MPQTAPPATAKPERNRRLLWILFICLAGSTAVSFIVFRYVVASVPREIVGTWRVVEGDYKGATFECSWSGSGIFTMSKNGKRESTESSIRVRGKRIFMTSKHPLTNAEDTLILLILKLTDDELVFRDQDQTVYNMIRIR
jgi:hypothetical protein